MVKKRFYFKACMWYVRGRKVNEAVEDKGEGANNIWYKANKNLEGWLNTSQMDPDNSI